MNTPNSFQLSGQRPLRSVVSRTQRFARQHPLIAKAVPSAIGFVFGELLTQYSLKRSKKQSQWHPERTALMAGAGILSAPVGLAVLQANILAGSPHSLMVKLILDQVVGCAIWQAAYIAISPQYRSMAQNLVKPLVDKPSQPSQPVPVSA